MGGEGGDEEGNLISGGASEVLINSGRTFHVKHPKIGDRVPHIVTQRVEHRTLNLVSYEKA
ncbi:hypothetical protein HNR05_002801 [Leifsonia psychrotolerans]|uniref:Uncharacterized protein n=1 Tax=Glaciibacter psychrotolerans TaxID=670054 RepID=A0A7Z0EGV6_9MICO|nr:hypothetical protein [Leifsonia psychrotolerans]